MSFMDWWWGFDGTATAGQSTSTSPQDVIQTQTAKGPSLWESITAPVSGVFSGFANITSAAKYAAIAAVLVGAAVFLKQAKGLLK